MLFPLFFFQKHFPTKITTIACTSRNVAHRIREFMNLFSFWNIAAEISRWKRQLLEPRVFQFQPELLRLILHKSTSPIYRRQLTRIYDLAKFKNDRSSCTRRSVIKQRTAMNFKLRRMSSIAYFWHHSITRSLSLFCYFCRNFVIVTLKRWK